jgi:tetratricopeptide (TPR) repeat protein
MGIHFAYPNVKDSIDIFTGCARYLAISPDDVPEDYKQAAPSVDNITTITAAASILAPESFEPDENTRGVYQIKDDAKQVYKGDSQGLAYLLALVNRTRNIKLKISDSEEQKKKTAIWCTGSIEIISGDRPFLREVLFSKFKIKLNAFISKKDNKKDDRLFIVPISNILPEYDAIFKKENVRFLTLKNLEESKLKLEDLFKSKTVLAVHGSELSLLVDILFEKPSLFGLNPYKGLSAFQETDAEFFFGREELIEVLYNDFKSLHESPLPGKEPLRLLAILGPSGSGKSSVARAGLIDKLNKDLLPDVTHLQVVSITPGSNPIDTLARNLARVTYKDDIPVAKAKEFAKEMRNGNGKFDGLGCICESIYETNSSWVFILVDQFEEIYSLCENDNERTQFINNILFASTNPTAHVSVVITVRSDFIGSTQSHSELNHAIAKNNIIVPAMNKDELHRAITEPVLKAGHSIDSDTVESLISQTVGRDGALPLLQFTLTQIWEGMVNKQSPAETLKRIGGLGGALAGEAERIYGSLDDKGKKIARRIFCSLVNLGEDRKDTRTRVPLSYMISHEDDPEYVRKIIRSFEQRNARLIITLPAELGSEEMAEITHEVLFENWKTLRTWLDEDRDDIRFKRRLSDQAYRWDDKGRASGYLWRSPDLELLKDYHKRSASDMTQLEIQFHRASVRKKQLSTSFKYGLVFLLILSTLSSGFFYWKTNREKKNTLKQRNIALQASNAIIYELTEGSFRAIPGYLKAQLNLIQRAKEIYEESIEQIGGSDVEIKKHRARALYSISQAYYKLGELKLYNDTSAEYLRIAREMYKGHPDEIDNILRLIHALSVNLDVHAKNQDIDAMVHTQEELINYYEKLEKYENISSTWKIAIPIKIELIKAVKNLMLSIDKFSTSASSRDAFRSMMANFNEKYGDKLDQWRAFEDEIQSKYGTFPRDKIEMVKRVLHGVTEQGSDPKGVEQRSIQDLEDDIKSLVVFFEKEKNKKDKDYIEFMSITKTLIDKYRYLLDYGPNNYQWRKSLAYYSLELGRIEGDILRHFKKEPYLYNALRILEQLSKDYKADIDVKLDILLTYIGLINNNRIKRDKKGAEYHYKLLKLDIHNLLNKIKKEQIIRYTTVISFNQVFTLWPIFMISEDNFAENITFFQGCLKNIDEVFPKFSDKEGGEELKSKTHKIIGDISYKYAHYIKAFDAYKMSYSFESDFSESDCLHLNNKLKGLASIFKNNNNLEKAIEAYLIQLEIIDTLIEKQPDNNKWIKEKYSTCTSLGNIYDDKQEWVKLLKIDTERLSIAEKLVEKEPENLNCLRDLSGSHYNLGYVNSKLKNKKSTVEHYQRAIEFADELSKKDPDFKLQPYLSNLNYLAGTAYRDLNQKDKAIMNFKHVLPDTKFYADAVIQTSFLYQKQGKSELAISCLEDVIEKRFNDPKLLIYLSSLYQKSGEFEKAAKVLKQGLVIDNNSTKYHFELGNVYYRWGKKNKSIEEMKAVLRIDPKHAIGLNYLGLIYVDLEKNLDEAERLIKAALKLKPDNGYFTDSLGWVYYKKGQYHKALAYLEKSINLLPDDPITLEHLGDVYLKLNNKEKALDCYNKSLIYRKNKKDKEKMRKKIQSLAKVG